MVNQNPDFGAILPTYWGAITLVYSEKYDENSTEYKRNSMDKRIKQLWVDALLSGEYKQGSGYLRKRSDRSGNILYCCLGVLCDLYIKETEGEEWVEFFQNSVVSWKCDKSWSYLPRTVAEWAEFHPEDLSDAGDIIAPQGRYLATLNDNGESFYRIAHIIQDEL